MSAPDDADAARSHVLLRLDESAVRAEIAEVIAAERRSQVSRPMT
jgi:hypothetical protein